MTMTSVKARQAVERRIVRRFVCDALKAGYRLGVSLERGYDTDDMLLGSRDEKAIMDAALAGDECHIFVQPKTGPLLDADRVVSEGWVYLVYGNDGWDVISDYTTNLEKNVLKGALALSDEIGDGD